MERMSMRPVFSFALSLAWVVLGLPSHGQDLPRSQETANSPQLRIESALEHGNRLAGEKKWGEALSHFEGAVRLHPGNRQLEESMHTARAHFDLARRYSDSNFLSDLDDMPAREANQIYDEVLQKIQNHYYGPPDWKMLLSRGAAAFDVALSEDVFLDHHARRGLPDDVRLLRREIRQAAENAVPKDRRDIERTVQVISNLANDRLGVPTTATTLEFAVGAVASLDEYSTFLTGGQLDEVYSQIEGNFVGLGVELKTDEDKLLVIDVIEGGPASLGGIRSGEQILAVDGRRVKEIGPDKAADLLRGEEGTKVLVELLAKDGKKRTVDLIRRRVDVPCVQEIKIVDSAAGVGYFQVSSFQKSTARDVDAALWRLHKLGMKSLIIDLRGNPGGLLNAAVEVADKFLTEGSIVTTRGRSPRENYEYVAHAPGTWRVPLVVLIDGESASASEIFAGAIKDQRRGAIVGERSYGKGSVQGIFPLSSSKAGVRLTTAKFFSPSGQAISRHGVIPDKVVHAVAKPIDDTNSLKPASIESDPVVKAAITVARDQVAQRQTRAKVGR